MLQYLITYDCPIFFLTNTGRFFELFYHGESGTHCRLRVSLLHLLVYTNVHVWNNCYFAGTVYIVAERT